MPEICRLIDRRTATFSTERYGSSIVVLARRSGSVPWQEANGGTSSSRLRHGPNALLCRIDVVAPFKEYRSIEPLPFSPNPLLPGLRHDKHLRRRSPLDMVFESPPSQTPCELTRQPMPRSDLTPCAFSLPHQSFAVEVFLRSNELMSVTTMPTGSIETMENERLKRGFSLIV